MLSLIIIGYLGVVVLAFKVVKIKVSPTSIAEISAHYRFTAQKLVQWFETVLWILSKTCRLQRLYAFCGALPCTASDILYKTLRPKRLN